MGPMAPSPEKEEELGWNSMEWAGYVAARRQGAEESEQNPLLSIFFLDLPAQMILWANW